MTTETADAPNPADITDDLAAFEREMTGEPPVETTETPEEAPAEVVETPEEAPVAEETTETEEESAEEEKAKKGRSTADRIRKLTAEKKAAERAAAEVAELRKEIEALRAGAAPKPLTETPEKGNVASSEAPDPAKYQYGELDPQFMRDTAKYEAQALIAEFQANQRRESEETQQREAAQREAAALREKAESINKAGVAKFDDFEDVVVEAAKRGEYTLTREMFELASETEAAAEILYHLASNPEEAELVASLPPAKQALWFGRKEAQLAAPPTPPARKITQAGAPPASLPKGSGSGGSVRLDDLDDPRALDEIQRQLFGRK